MNKNGNLKHLIEVLNSLDRSLEILIEKVHVLKFIRGNRPQPVPVRVRKPEHPF
jgi:hypothetical protein